MSWVNQKFYGTRLVKSVLLYAINHILSYTYNCINRYISLLIRWSLKLFKTLQVQTGNPWDHDYDGTTWAPLIPSASTQRTTFSTIISRLTTSSPNFSTKRSTTTATRSTSFPHVSSQMSTKKGITILPTSKTTKATLTTPQIIKSTTKTNL